MEKEKEFFRRFSKPERDHIIFNVITSIRDVYDSIDCVREDMRALEGELDGVLYGKTFGSMLDEFREEIGAEMKAA